MIRWLKIRKYECGFLFRNQEFHKILRPGRHFVWGLRTRVRVVSVRDVWLPQADLDVIVRAGVLEGDVCVLDLQDHERALVWVDGRFESVRGPGLRVAHASDACSHSGSSGKSLFFRHIYRRGSVRRTGGR